MVAYTDGSRNEDGRVGGGWWGSRGAECYLLVGTIVTVWDGEVASMWLSLESLSVTPVLLLSDSQAAIAAVCNGAADGWARTADLSAVVDAVREWATHSVLLGLA